MVTVSVFPSSVRLAVPLTPELFSGVSVAVNEASRRRTSSISMGQVRNNLFFFIATSFQGNMGQEPRNQRRAAGDALAHKARASASRSDTRHRIERDDTASERVTEDSAGEIKS